MQRFLYVYECRTSRSEQDVHTKKSEANIKKRAGRAYEEERSQHQYAEDETFSLERSQHQEASRTCIRRRAKPTSICGR
nr:hypothetical protein CFP56_53351 [Quercus suber]